VTDPAGKSSSDTISIKVGNTLPLVTIQATDNKTFFFPRATAFNYNVEVTDKEDKVIDKKKVKVGLKYIAKVAGQQAEMGHVQLNENYNYGKSLMASSDCKACHQMNAKSVGPSFVRIAAKYKNDNNAVGYLANKIISGGAGVWGEHGMSAHPQISKEDATEIVKYIMAVSSQQGQKTLPKEGSVVLKEHVGGTEQGRYIMTASYTDKGGAIKPLTNSDVLVLRPSRFQAEDADVVYNLRKTQQNLGGINHGSYFVIKSVDLKDIDSVTYRIGSLDKSGTIEVRVDAPRGKVISTLNYQPTGAFNKPVEVSTPITDPGGKHDLYFVFTKADLPNKNIASLDWVQFEGGGKEVIEPPALEKKQAPKSQNPPAKTAATKPTATEKKTEMDGSAGRALMAKSDCNSCHAPNKKLVGPSFTAIANKYKNNNGAIERLTGKVINGGAGVWAKYRWRLINSYQRKM
jgi:cytochrome c